MRQHHRSETPRLRNERGHPRHRLQDSHSELCPSLQCYNPPPFSLSERYAQSSAAAKRNNR